MPEPGATVSAGAADDQVLRQRVPEARKALAKGVRRPPLKARAGTLAADVPPALLDDLIGWLRIPSISTGGGRRADLDAAAQSAVTRVREAGVAMVDADTPAITVGLRGIAQLPT
jgi:hypothetical protein